MRTQVLPEIEEEITPFDEMAHYVRIASLMKGGPQVALCGKKFIPQEIANARKYPICPKCKKLHDMLHLMYPDSGKDL